MLTLNTLRTRFGIVLSVVIVLALLAFILSDTLLGFQYLSDYFLIPRGSFIYYAIFFGRKICYPFYILSQILMPISMASRRMKKLRA